jgi:2-polyprenyl-3-methyl-5-hydroxy-6-metoxy-1,4-benzoquinol methylase
MASDFNRMERISRSGFVPPWIRREHEARFEFCARYVGAKRVIDCAAGEGLGSRMFAQNGARIVIAADRSLQSLHHLPQGSLTAVAGDAVALPIRNASADVFIGLETIEHLESGAAFAREAARCLRADGIFICSTPNREVTNPATSPADRVFNPFHVREYTREEFLADLSPAFGNVEILGQSPQSTATSATFAWLGRRVS